MKFAMAKIEGGESYPKLKGKVIFENKGNKVLVTAHICNLPQTRTNIFAFHLHEGTDCNGKNFENTKGHFNPEKNIHPNHAGDMPPLFSNEGRAFLSFETNRFVLDDVIGRAVVVHLHEDDFTTQPSGNAGEKMGCGIIKPL